MVSVIIPAYNAEKYLPEAVASVISQSSSYWSMTDRPIPHPDSATLSPLPIHEYASSTSPTAGSPMRATTA